MEFTLPLKIGTRGSPLALAMTAEVMRLLAASLDDLKEPGAMESVVIKTTGDRIQDRALAEVGGKGAFTKEIDEALLAGHIHLAMNSLKDVPTWLPDGIHIASVPEREDARDAFVCPGASNLAGLKEGSVIGTASLRRQAQILNRYPSLRVALFRGNVDTRIEKLARGEVDATLLAVAGLKRLGRADVVTSVIDPNHMLPAVGQGAMGITCRSDDAAVNAMLASLDHRQSRLCITAERALLDTLDGSCHTPIAALATITAQGCLDLRGRLIRPDGSELLEADGRNEDAGLDEAASLGHAVGEDLLSRASAEFLESIRGH